LHENIKTCKFIFSLSRNRQIDPLVRMRVSKKSAVRGGGSNNDGDCVICHESLYETQMPKIYLFLLQNCTECLTCRIVVHKACIKTWFLAKDSCPFCRSREGFDEVKPHDDDDISLENLNERDGAGFTALTLACAKRLNDVAMRILNDHAEIVNTKAISDNGFTALMYACDNRMNNVATKLLLTTDPEKLNLSTSNEAGDTALMLSCRRGLNEVGMQILRYAKHHVNMGAVNLFSGKTALILASEQGLDDVTLELLKYPERINMGAADIHGTTALMIACKQGKRQVAMSLLNHAERVNLGSVERYHGETALMMACRNGLEDVVAEILEYPKYANIGAVNRTGKTALMLALSDSGSTLPSKKNIALRLLEHPKEVNIGAMNRVMWQDAMSLAREHKLNDIVKIIEGMKLQTKVRSYKSARRPPGDPRR